MIKFIPSHPCNSAIAGLVKQTMEVICACEYEDLPCLISGNSGLVLFLAYYYARMEHDERVLIKIEALLHEIFAQVNALPLTSSLATGYAGIGWLLCKLKDLGIIDDEPEIHSQFIEAVSLSIQDDIANNDFDFLYGLMGKCLYLRKVSSLSEELRRAIANKLESMAPLDSKLSIFADDGKVNMGLAHGIPSLVSFLEDTTINLPKVREEIIGILAEPLSERNRKKRSYSLYANFISSSSSEEDYDSRYGWCYGDLGVLFSVTKMQHWLPCQTLESIQSALISVCRKRNVENGYLKFMEDSGSYDIGLCHGLAGIHHMQAGIHTALEKRKSMSTVTDALPIAYWEDQFVSNWKMRMKKGDFSTLDTEHDGLNLLNGICGAGLVGIGSLTGDKSWGECLMLN